MDEIEIIQMLHSRNQSVIHTLTFQYGAYCRKIAENILESSEDVEECLNDTFLKVWNSIPPHHPDNLTAYIGTITRNLAFDRYRMQKATKRGGNITLVLDELSEIASGEPTPEQIYDRKELTEAINVFLSTLPPWKRYILIRRCWYADSISQIAEACKKSESSISMTLTRLRRKLYKHLKERGFDP